MSGPQIMDRRALVPATSAARCTIWAFGAYAIWQGAGIAIGGLSRWSGPSFNVLRRVDHASTFWGILLVVAGVVILTGSLWRLWRVKLAGLIGLILWSLLFAIGAFAASMHIPTVPTTGGKTYSLIALVSVILIFIDERKRDDA